MVTFAHRLGRVVASLGLVAALALTPAAAEAGPVRGIHRGRAIHRHHAHRAVRRPVARHAVVRPHFGPRVLGIATPPLVVQPFVVNPFLVDVGW